MPNTHLQIKSLQNFTEAKQSNSLNSESLNLVCLSLIYMGTQPTIIEQGEKQQFIIPT